MFALIPNLIPAFYLHFEYCSFLYKLIYGRLHTIDQVIQMVGAYWEIFKIICILDMNYWIKWFETIVLFSLNCPPTFWSFWILNTTFYFFLKLSDWRDYIMLFEIWIIHLIFPSIIFLEIKISVPHNSMKFDEIFRKHMMCRNGILQIN